MSPPAPPSPGEAQPDLDELRKLACAAARIGGGIAAEAFGKRMRVEFKSDRSEVTEHDRAAEGAIAAFLRQRRPYDGFLGEESSDPAAPAAASAWTASSHGSGTPEGVTWVVDPIDGTRNFTRGAPLFACSVAAMRGGRPIAGAIYDPLRDQMFSAAQGRGAWRGDARLRVAGPPGAAGAQRPGMIVAIPSSAAPATAALVQQIIDRHVVRNLGCTTLHLVMVASGQIDAALMNNTRLWDIAAGAIIVSEAGGTIGDPLGAWRFPLDPAGCREQDLPTLAASPETWRRLLDRPPPT